MKSNISRFLTAAFLCCISIYVTAADYLFDNGRSSYTIIVDANASKTEQTAARELQSYIKKVSGVALPVSNNLNAAGACILVGYNSRVAALTDAPQPAADDEGFRWQTVNGNLLIYGGSHRGTMYGVFAFLEKELGVHWLTSSVTHTPRRSSYELRPMNHAEQPVIQSRLDFCYDALRHYDWSAHHLLNSHYGLADGAYGKALAYWGIHTFEQLIPPAQYFSTHPEYFSVYKGQRSDKAQLCLSNAAMCRELIKNLKEIIRTKPGYWCYDVSQNDNRLPCECRACQRLVRKYGGQSGAMLWFVNKVAAEVKKEFPEVLIGTFAYQYTRQAPKSNIRPADNVVIRLCNIECCMAHPLEQCEQNRSFLSDMNDWRRIARRIYIWDYTTGFRNYLLPFPNFKTLAANYQYFKNSNVIGVMEEGAHDAPWSEFSELKQWMIAKLLWNPYQDTDSLAQVFINAYYGKAASQVYQYYQLCQRQVTPDRHFSVKLDWKSPIFTDPFIVEGQSVLKKATAAVAGDADMRKRVDRLSAQLLYLKFRRSPAVSSADGTLKELRQIVKSDSTVLAEFGYTIDKMLKDTGYH